MVNLEEKAAWELQRDHAELALNSGEAAQALRLSAELVATPGIAELPELDRSIRHIHALALESTGDLEGAIHQLDPLVTEGPRGATWIRRLIDLSRCYREAGDLSRAIDVGERALEPIARLGAPGIGEGLRLAATVAGAYFYRGDVVHAMHLCRRAIEEAERVGSREGRAAAYWNASVIAAGRGKTEEAIPMATAALALFEQGEDARNLARLRSTVVEMQLLLPDPDLTELFATLRQAWRELEWANASPMDKANHLTTWATALLLDGDLAAADEQVSSALALVAGKAPLHEADALIVRARIAFTRGDREAALTAYRDAVGRLTGIGADRRVAELWFEVGGALERLGATEEALAAYRSSAVSAGVVVRPEITQPHVGTAQSHP